MTSLAFVLGVLPLAIANGAGSGSENAVGRGVIGGMLSATFLAPFLIPMFFYVIHGKLFKPKDSAAPESVDTTTLESSGVGAAE
jgi:multidrug efflux pump